jgi:hypothetical protein
VISFKIRGTLGSVASLLAAFLYQGNPDRNHKLWNIVSRYTDSDYPFDIFKIFRHYNGQKKKSGRIYNTLHRKLKIDQQESH